MDNRLVARRWSLRSGAASGRRTVVQRFLATVSSTHTYSRTSRKRTEMRGARLGPRRYTWRWASGCRKPRTFFPTAGSRRSRATNRTLAQFCFTRSPSPRAPGRCVPCPHASRSPMTSIEPLRRLPSPRSSCRRSRRGGIATMPSAPSTLPPSRTCWKPSTLQAMYSKPSP